MNSRSCGGELAIALLLRVALQDPCSIASTCRGITNDSMHAKSDLRVILKMDDH